MNISIPHRVEYQFTGPVSIPEVIGTLDATQRIAEELATLLEGVVDGLVVERIAVHVQDIEEGSLREYFLLALAIAYQDDLKRSVPPMVSQFLGVHIPDKYDGLVTACVVLLLYFGAEYVLKKTAGALKSNKLGEQIDVLVSELAEATGTSETRIRRALEKQFAKSSKLKKIGRAAVEFFRPSRARQNEPILVGDKLIASDVVAEVPKENLEPEEQELIKSLTGVRVEIHAKDKDKDTVGWAATLRNVTDARLKMVLYPTVNREQLWEKDEVKGDVIVHYKPDNDPEGDGVRPYMFYLLRVDDDPPSPHSDGQSGNQ